MKNRKAIAIFTVFLMLGGIIYQASANEGVYESYDDSIVTSIDEADEAIGSEDDDTLDETIGYGEDDAFLDAVHPDIEIDLDSGLLDDPSGDWGYFDCDDFEIEEPEGGFVGIAPAFARLPHVAMRARCFYTGDFLTIQHPSTYYNEWIPLPVTWYPCATIAVPPLPSPFHVSFNLADALPVPEGWSFVGAAINYVPRRPDGTWDDYVLVDRPMEQVGDTMTYQFPFDFNIGVHVPGPGGAYAWPAYPVIILEWRPDPPTIVKEVTPETAAAFPVSVGDEVEYTITVTNPAVNSTLYQPGAPQGPPGPGGNIIEWPVTVFDGFRVVDELPPELALVPGSVSVPDGIGAVDNSCAVNNVIDVTFNIPGSNEVTHPVVITFRATVTEAALLVDEIINTAWLYNPHTEEPTYDEEIVPVAQPDVSLVKSVYPTAVDPGETVTYTLVVTNTGDIPLTNVVVIDDLPVQLTNLRNLAIDPADAGTGSIVGQLLTVTIPELEVDDSVTITFDATVAGNVAGGTTIVNVAEVTTDQEVYDEDDARVTVNVPPVLRNPGISLDKSVSSGTVAPGGTLTYTLVVRNTGNEVLTSVEVIDDLPAQLTNPRNLVISPEGAGTGDFEGQLLTVNIPALGIGQVVTITFDVTVAPGVANGTVIRNVATVTTDQNVEDEDDARTTVEVPREPEDPEDPEEAPQQPGEAPRTGDHGMVNLLYMLLVAMASLSLVSLTIAEKRRMRR